MFLSRNKKNKDTFWLKNNALSRAMEMQKSHELNFIPHYLKSGPLTAGPGRYFTEFLKNKSQETGLIAYILTKISCIRTKTTETQPCICTALSGSTLLLNSDFTDLFNIMILQSTYIVCVYSGVCVYKWKGNLTRFLLWGIGTLSWETILSELFTSLLKRSLH